MANLTITVDDDVLLRARKRALDQGTSVNAVIRVYLEGYVGVPRRAEAMKQFLDHAAKVAGRSSRRWSRDDLHDR
jgi:hypothetical protein